MSGDRRRVAERRGRTAEGLAVLSLRLRGYGIVGRRIRTPAGEIDIAARRGGILAIIEVKARETMTQAVEALSRRQRRRIVSAAEWFIAQESARASLTVRFDLILVARRRWPRHIPDAWRPGD